MNIDAYNNLPKEVRPPLEHTRCRLLGIKKDSPVPAMGKVKLPIEIGGKLCEASFLVADAAGVDSLLLGLPFLEKHGMMVNFGTSQVYVDGKQVSSFGASPKEHRVSVVRVARTVVLCPNQEYLVPGNIHHRGKVFSEGVIEPARGFVTKYGVVVGRTAVDTTKSRGRTVVRVFNPGSEEVTIQKGAIAGLLHPVIAFLQPDELEPIPIRSMSHGKSTPSLTVPEHVAALFEESRVGLSLPEQEELAQMLRDYSDVFSKGPHDLGRTNLVKHDIELTPGPPIKLAPRRMATEKQADADAQVEQSVQLGLAKKSNSANASPLVMALKKDGTRRLCVDYRLLNDRTIKDAYPLPRINDTLDTLSGAKWFSTLDLASGYWQVEMTPRAQDAAAFCSRKGLFSWSVMPFGLCNAPATFQRLMDRVLSGLQWEICLVYLDDIIVPSETLEQMILRLRQVLERFRQAGLKLKPSKCFLFRREVQYLGHVVSEHGVSCDPAKIQAIQDWPTPKNVHEVRAFVGLASYYRRFVKDFAGTAQCLHELTKKHAKFVWSETCQAAFEELKCRLMSAPILGYPQDEGQLILDTDASNTAMGAVLSQIQDGEERPLAYGSKRLSASEQNYCTTRRELLAVVYYVCYFRQYLMGKDFVVRTDHSSLRWLVNMKDPEGQLSRWLSKLGEFGKFPIEYRPGRRHGNADAMSRKPCPKACPCTVPPPSDSSVQTCEQGVQCDFPPPSDGLVGVRCLSQMADTPAHPEKGVEMFLSTKSPPGQELVGVEPPKSEPVSSMSNPCLKGEEDKDTNPQSVLPVAENCTGESLCTTQEAKFSMSPVTQVIHS